MSARTQISYLSPALSQQQPGPSKGKLRKAERDTGGKVLPIGAGTGYGQTNSNGKLATGYVGTSGGYGNQLGPRIKDSLAHAKEKRREARQGDQVSRRNMIVDEDGVAHDSEYVQFRTATPVHIHRRQEPANGEHPNDDDSASSSSSSDSDESGFPSSPYTYQSTHRTTTSNHHYSAPMGTTASAIPAYMQAEPRRSSESKTSLTVPRAPSPRRTSGELDRSMYGTSKLSKKDRDRPQNGYTTASFQPPAKFTTSSYQPPAPAFSTRATDFNSALRLPPRAASSGTGSLAESTAQLSLADNNVKSSSGYNTFAESQRPPKLDGSALDAGVHGMKRSWDGFKLETKFAARRLGKGVERKLRNM